MSSLLSADCPSKPVATQDLKPYGKSVIAMGEVRAYVQ